MRKIGLLTAALFAATLHAPQPQAPQPPVFRAVVAGPLLDRRGHPLTDFLLASGTDVPGLRLALGNLGRGDDVIELAQQYIAFRVAR